MRYEDASGSFQASGPIANDDSDTLPAGSRQAATGNLITGEGTQYGSAGADSAAGAHITSIAGKGGEDTSFAGGKLSVTGEHGNLSVDAEGNYNYMANKGAPENVRDRFTYTLADNQGNSDTAALIIELGKTPVVIKADAQQIVPGPDGVVTLPPGVDLSDVMVVGRNLVINMPDGTQLIIIDGAVFVPQLVFDGVQVPATNVAALLIGQEPQPAAGELPPSSGGNFALPPPPLDPGVPLGDLIPPTVRDYVPPEPQELFPEEDSEPEITIQPDGQPASVNAVDEVDEAGLPTRDGDLLDEPEGSGEEAAAGANGDPSEATSGVINIDSPDEPNVITINGVAVTSVGQEFDGAYGTLTITSISDTEIGYIYTLFDNIDHSDGDPDQDDFSVTVTDVDGDQATATLTIDIIDDVPTARNDVDSVVEGGPEVADGNVLTGSGGADVNSTDGVADTVGADDADLTGFSQGNTNGTLGAPFAAQYGTLVLNSDGSYTYTLDSDDPAVQALGEGDTLTEVFTYTLTDGDGDVDTATLTITIIGTNEAPVIGNGEAVVSEEGLPPGIEDDDGVPSDTTNSPTDSGTISVSDPDGDPVTVTLSLAGLPALTSNTVPVVWALSDGGHTLTGTAGGDPIITITINDDGDFTVTLNGPIDHADPTVEDIRTFDVQVVVDDGSETDTGTLTVTIEDDSPSITAGEVEPELLADESDFTVNDTEDFGDVFTALFGGDGGDPDSITYELGTPGGDSGLVDTLTNEAVVLTKEGDNVVGRAGAGGPIVFVVSVDADGNVTVDQQRAVVHADPTDHDDSISLASDDLITLTATATDNDGDSDSATINIGKNVVLEDDGPSISRNQNAVPDLVTDDTDIPDSDGPVSFAGLFTGAFGADGPLDVDDNDVPDADALTYSLSINGGDGTDSGLNDVLTGDNILLRVVGNTIEGYLENDTGTVAFTLTLDPDTGEITQQQARAITHDDPTDHEETGADAETMAANLIILTATITDGDGDTASATADIGDAFHFEDDGPSCDDEPQQDVQEGNQTISGTFDFDAGSDGGGVTHLNGIALVFDGITGWSQWIAVDDGQIRAQFDGSYEFQTDAAGSGVTSGTFTVTDGDGDTDVCDWAFNITDANAPTAGVSVALVDDDGLAGNNPASTTGDIDANASPPEVAPVNGEQAFHGQLVLNFGGDGPGTVTFAAMHNQTGAVGTETVRYSWNGGTSTLTATIEGGARNGTVLFDIVVNQTTGEFTLTLRDNVLHAAGGDETSAPNVALTYTVTDSDNSPAGGVNGTLNVTFNDDAPTAAVASLVESVSVDETAGIQLDSDDTTNAGVIALFAGVTDKGTDADMPAPQYGQSGSALVSSTGSVYGADGAGTTVFSLDVSAAGVDSGLDTTAGASIFLFKEGNLIVGRVGDASGDAAFAVAINPTTGVVSMVQYMSLDHPNPANPDESISIADGAILGVVTITDADGDVDTESVGIGDQIQFQDDAPTAAVVSAVETVSVDETAGIQGDSDDTTDAGVIALFAGVGNKGTDADMPAPQFGQSDIGLIASTGSSYGADGAGTTVFSLDVSAAGVDSGLDTTAGDSIFLFKEGNLIVGRVGNGAGPAAFAVAIDPVTGVVSMVEYMSIKHPNPANPDESVSITDGAILGVATVTDGDGDVDTESVGIGDQIQFQDDAPNAVAELNADGAVELDESLPSTASTITLVNGIVKGDDPGHLNTDGIAIGRAVSAEAVVNLTGATNYGADGPAADPADAVYSLAIDNAVSGLTTTEGNAINLVSQQNGTVIVGVVQGGTFAGQAAFAIQINPATGVITVEQYLSLNHPDDTDPNDVLGMTAGHISAVVTIQDGDGDTDASNAVDISGLITFLDDGPVITAVTDPLEIDNVGPTPTGTGDFEFDVGADDNADFDDISVSGFTITINGDPAQNVLLFANQDGAGNPAPETAANAFYRFTFQYDTGLGGLANGTGTLVFNKATGEYTVAITSGPISGFTIADLNSIDAGDFVGHDAPGQGGGQDEIVVAPFAEDLFVQFTGQARNTNANEADEFLQTEDFEEINPPPAAEAPADPNNVFVAGDLFAQPTTETDLPSVTVSSADAGVNGNTIQTGEVIDFNLYATDPGGTLGLAPDASASDMFIVFDNFDPGDDLIVILKLMDPDTGVFTTKAVVVNQGDYYMLPDAALLDGTVYETIVSDPSFGNNDSLLVIESNDYNTAPGENWVIVGAQVTNNPDGVTGTGINLDRDLGPGGGSVGTESFATDTDVSNLKISNIGFIRPSTTDQQATIEFDVTVTDGDGDSVTQTDVTVNIGGAAIPMPLPLLAESTNQTQQLQKTADNSNTLTMAAAVAAAGFSGKAAAYSDHGGNSHDQNADLASFAAPEVIENYSVDDGGDAAVSMLAPDTSSEASAPADAPSGSAPDSSDASNSLDDSAAKAAPEPSDLPAGDDGAADSSDAAGPVAPTVAMVSAEALEAAANDNGNAQQGGSVEQIVADALDQGSAPDLDAVLANLPDSGNGALQAIAHMASPDVAAVSGWNMGGHGAIGAGFDMMFKMDVAMHHQDAVQPVQNG